MKPAAATPAAPAGHLPASLWALSLLAFFMADVRDGLGPFLATYLQKAGLQQELIGLTLTAGGLATVLMTPFAGAWVDRSKAKRALTVVAAVLVLGSSAVAFTTLSGAWLIASQVVTGLAGAMLGATMAALTLGLSRASGFKRQMGRNEAWSHGGNMLSAIGAGLAAHLLGAPWILVVMAVMTVGMLASVLAIRAKDIDHAAARGEEADDAAAPALREQVRAMSQSALPTPLAQAPRPAPAPSTASSPSSVTPGRAGLSQLLRQRPLLWFALTCAFFHLGNAAMLPLLNQRLAATVADSAPLLWTGVAIVVAQLTMIPVALWVSRSRRFDIGWFVIAAILVLPVRGALAWSLASAWSNVPVQILDGLAAGAMGVATPLLVQRYIGGSGRFNTALGFVMTLQGIGAALSPGIANAVVGAQGRFGLAFLVLAGAALLALPAFWMAQRSAGARVSEAPTTTRLAASAGSHGVAG